MGTRRSALRTLYFHHVIIYNLVTAIKTAVTNPIDDIKTSSISKATAIKTAVTNAMGGIKTPNLQT